MLEKSILNTLIEHSLKIDDCLLVAVSGGADSVALLDVLVKSGRKVAVAHFNHQLRPSADREMEFVDSLAERYGVKFFSKTANIRIIANNQKKGLEDTARTERYQYLFTLAKEKKLAAVLTAHHADDQVETVIFNLVRGSGLSGLLGIRSISYTNNDLSIPLIRPMLECWKRDILAYCEANLLDYVVDESNLDTSLTRNFIRHEIIPALEKINPNLKLNIHQTTEILEADYDFIESSSNLASKNIIKKIAEKYVEFDIEEFLNYPVSIQRFVIKNNLAKYFNNKEGYTYNQIEKCRMTLLGKYSTGFNQIADELCVLVEDGSGFITKNLEMIPNDIWPGINFELTIKTSGSYNLNDQWVVDINIMDRNQVNTIDLIKNTNPFVAFLDLKKNPVPIIIRSIKPGDTYAPMGMKGKHTKVSDCFINRKVPRRFRKNWPLACSVAGQIIWIPGFQPSSHAMIDENTKKLVKLEIRKRINY